MYIYLQISYPWVLALNLSIPTTGEKISLEATPQSLAQKRSVKLALFGNDESKQNPTGFYEKNGGKLRRKNWSKRSL